jgi:hypothetical protein
MTETTKELKEENERVWFRRVMTILMIGTIGLGALPLIQGALFPVDRTNR